MDGRLVNNEKNTDTDASRPLAGAAGSRARTQDFTFARLVLAGASPSGAIHNIPSTTMSTQGGRPGGGGDAAMGAASSSTSNPLVSDPGVGEKRKASAETEQDTTATTAEASSPSTSRKKSKKRPWTTEEDASLMEIVLATRSEQEEGSGGSNPEVTDEEDDDDWDEISKSVLDRTAVQCLQRFLHLEKKRKGSVCLVVPMAVCFSYIERHETTLL